MQDSAFGTGRIYSFLTYALVRQLSLSIASILRKSSFESINWLRRGRVRCFHCFRGEPSLSEVPAIAEGSLKPVLTSTSPLKASLPALLTTEIACPNCPSKLPGTFGSRVARL